MQKEETIQIVCKLKKEIVNRLDSRATNLNLNRAQLMRNLIDTGLDELDFYDKIGLLGIVVKGYDILGNVKKSLSERKFNIDGKNRLIIDLK